MFLRTQFESACKGYAAKHQHKHWSWSSGYLSRTSLLHRSSHTLNDGDEDPATASPALHDLLTVQQYVVYSPTFRVPTFYFTIHDSTGAPLPLADIVHSSLFKFPPDSETTTFALTLPAASFPLLSQGEHPILGTPCWYLHPCESDAAVSELLSEIQQVGWSEEMKLVGWMEMWFMTVGTVLDV